MKKGTNCSCLSLAHKKIWRITGVMLSYICRVFGVAGGQTVPSTEHGVRLQARPSQTVFHY